MKNLKKNGGFTLVELIVVIAILAILAAVAVPAYSGYIEKANQAGDQTLIAAINRAFTSTCVENGIPVTSIGTAIIPVGANGEIGNDTSLSAAVGTGTKYLKGLVIDGKTASADVLKAFDDAFAVYFSGNQTAKFKTIQSRNLVFNPLTLGFIDMLNFDGEVQLSYGGETILVSAQDVKKLSNSTFINAEQLGSQGLLDKVNDVTNFAAGLTSTNIMTDILTDTLFQQTAANAVGCQTSELSAKVAEMAQAMVDAGKATDVGEATAKIQANAAVLFAAQNAASMNKSDITAMLTAENAGTVITDNLTTDPSGSMANAALAYGMYTAYAYSTGNQTLIDKTNDPTDVMSQLDTKEFKDYINSSQGQADMDAYLSALNMINSSTGDKEAVTNLMINGFNDPALVETLNQALGK